MPPKLCLNQRTQERCVLGGPGKRYQPHLEAARLASAWDFGSKPEAQGEEGDSRFWVGLSHQLIKIGTARPRGALLLPHPHEWFMQSPDGSCRDQEQSQGCALGSGSVELASAPASMPDPGWFHLCPHEGGGCSQNSATARSWISTEDWEFGGQGRAVMLKVTEQRSWGACCFGVGRAVLGQQQVQG